MEGVLKLPRQWFVVCESRELKRKPLPVKLQGLPLVLFRDAEGKPHALLDRCPHRNVPLSLGQVREGLLQCSYHGWKFDGAGACREIPGFLGEPDSKPRRVERYPTSESQGYVWVYSSSDEAPAQPPFEFPLIGAPGYSTARQTFRVKASLHAALENALDVPHTAFLHGGLFRTEARRLDIDVVVKTSADRVEAEYLGEPRPPGLAGKILAPQGGTVTHFDRFILPCISQVEYRLGNTHLLVTSAMTPLQDADTRLFAVVTFKTPFPAFLVRGVLTPIAARIFNQDKQILEAQRENAERFGGEQFASTEVDVLGLQILRLMRMAAKGEPGPSVVQEHRLRMRV